MSTAQGGPAHQPPALGLAHLSKTFGGVRALVDVDLEARSGEIHALVGGNGSGKSTLIKILAGVYQADPGGVLTLPSTGAVPADQWSAARAFAANMRFVHQNPGVFPDLTVAENMAIGHGFPTTAGRIRWKDLRSRTAELIDRFDIRATPDAPVRSLNPADRTMVAVARALQDQDELTDGVLVLDEPTTTLPAHDIEVVLAALRRCAAQGLTILYVSHRIDEVLALADRISVLRDGQRVATRASADLSEPDLVELIAGRTLAGLSAAETSAEGSPAAVELVNVSAGRLRGIDLRLRRGEIVGVAGLIGSGRSTLLRTVFGAVPVAAGDLRLDGQPVRWRDPREAIRRGVAYVPEDRPGEAVFAPMSVRENISAGGVAAYFRRLRLRHQHESADAVDAMRTFLVQAASDRIPLATLSGGNQQKVVLARWLRRAPRVLLLDEPTQGVDVAARREIYDLIRAGAQAGTAVLVVANDFDELLRLCARVLVLRDGRIVGDLSGEQLTSHRLTELAYQTRSPSEAS
jgi:ABC-type sugar transport system ATPase subunit